MFQFLLDLSGAMALMSHELKNGYELWCLAFHPQLLAMFCWRRDATRYATRRLGLHACNDSSKIKESAFCII
jgi:hypothetical protein